MNIISNINGRNIIKKNENNEKILITGNLIDSDKLDTLEDFFKRIYNIRNIRKCIHDEQIEIIFGCNDVNLINLKMDLDEYESNVNYFDVLKKYNIIEHLPFTIAYEYSLINNLGVEKDIYELYKNRFDKSNLNKINYLCYLFIIIINDMLQTELYSFYKKGNFFTD
jgi:hypothetical protein